MSSPKPPTALERISGGLPVEATLTAVAALAGGPLAALLPVLSKSLAAERQRKRVEAALADIDALLRHNASTLERLTDQQYKFVNEAVLTLLHTTDERKISLLKHVVRNGLIFADMPAHESVFLSRVIRDISADEVDFLVRNFGTQRIWFNDTPRPEGDDSTLSVSPMTAEGQVVQGLVSLGLLSLGEFTWDDSGLLKFSPTVAKLLALLREPDAVGTGITPRPPHRSVRAELPHTAPASGTDDRQPPK